MFCTCLCWSSSAICWSILEVWKDPVEVGGACSSESILLYIALSSANSRIFDVSPFSMSLIYRRKSSGPRTVPCGTPDETSQTSELVQLPFSFDSSFLFLLSSFFLFSCPLSLSSSLPFFLVGAAPPPTMPTPLRNPELFGEGLLQQGAAGKPFDVVSWLYRGRIILTLFLSGSPWPPFLWFANLRGKIWQQQVERRL